MFVDGDLCVVQLFYINETQFHNIQLSSFGGMRLISCLNLANYSFSYWVTFSLNGFGNIEFVLKLWSFDLSYHLKSLFLNRTKCLFNGKVVCNIFSVFMATMPVQMLQLQIFLSVAMITKFCDVLFETAYLFRFYVFLEDNRYHLYLFI